MSLGDDVLAALPALRSEAESRMLDTFDILVPGDGYVFNGTEDAQEMTLLFSTKGRVKASSGLVARETEVGARTSVSVTRELHIPVCSPAVPTGAVAVPTSLHWSSDQSLAGAVLRLAGPAPGSQTTARRLEVSEVLT